MLTYLNTTAPACGCELSKRPVETEHVSLKDVQLHNLVVEDPVIIWDSSCQSALNYTKFISFGLSVGPSPAMPMRYHKQANTWFTKSSTSLGSHIMRPLPTGRGLNSTANAAPRSGVKTGSKFLMVPTRMNTTSESIPQRSAEFCMNGLCVRLLRPPEQSLLG